MTTRRLSSIRAPRPPGPLVRALALLVTCLIVAGSGRPARAATPPEIFESANSAYEEADFESAVAAYERILAYGLYDPRVHYNLGNAYFKLGRLGAAILHYERALKIDPGDVEARDNLELARGQIRDRTADPEIQFPLLAVKRLLDGRSPNRATWEFLLFYLPAAGLLGAIPLTRDYVRRKVLGYGAVVLGLCALVVLGGLVYKIRDVTTERAIVMRDRVDVLSGPGQNNTVLFTVHEGTRLDVRNRLEGWYQISLPNAGSGWVPKSTVEQV